jgi:hypothetical protein
MARFMCVCVGSIDDREMLHKAFLASHKLQIRFVLPFVHFSTWVTLARTSTESNFGENLPIHILSIPNIVVRPLFFLHLNPLEMLSSQGSKCEWIEPSDSKMYAILSLCFPFPPHPHTHVFPQHSTQEEIQFSQSSFLPRSENPIGHWGQARIHLWSW